MGGGRGEAHRVDEGAAAHSRHVGVAAQARRLDGLVQDGDVQGVVLHRFAPGQKQGGAGQGDAVGMFPAILFEVRQQAGMMPVKAPIHHGQHLFGQVAAAGPDDLMKQGILQVE